ncbi:YggT family protein [Oscillatoria sp. CS-180]|uniref:YggT family protein n=1 Tax=Oscillatoria sp. CS-180 TaxID=3021720 RepID=UPI00232E0038|nr:YggT family protein [Oscillatoria sp. CS-180]MDB9529166.1 YggT family protein [Oscillatoria sp. CS-180]
MAHPEDSRHPKPHPQNLPHTSGNQQDPWGADPEDQHERQRLAQEAARHTKARKSTLLDKFVRGVIYLVAALEVLLGLRFLLRFTAANPDNTFAGFIYNLSQPFVNPFSTLFISPTFDGSRYIFDVNVLVAMAAYLALLALFLGLMRVFFDQ